MQAPAIKSADARSDRAAFPREFYITDAIACIIQLQSQLDGIPATGVMSPLGPMHRFCFTPMPIAQRGAAMAT